MAKDYNTVTKQYAFTKAKEFRIKNDEHLEHLDHTLASIKGGWMLSQKHDGWGMHQNKGLLMSKSQKPFVNKLFYSHMENATKMAALNDLFMSAELVGDGMHCYDVQAIMSALGEYNNESIKRFELLHRKKSRESLDQGKPATDKLIKKLSLVNRMQELYPFYYDIVYKDQFQMKAIDRYALGEKITADFGYKMIPYVLVHTRDEVLEHLDGVINLGGEGVILRAAESPYIIGAVNKKLPEVIKIKNIPTEDAEVIRIIPRKHKKGAKIGEPVLWNGKKMLGKVIALYNDLEIQISVTGTFDKLVSVWEQAIENNAENGWVEFQYLARDNKSGDKSEKQFIQFRTVEDKGLRTLDQ